MTEGESGVLGTAREEFELGSGYHRQVVKLKERVSELEDRCAKYGETLNDMAKAAGYANSDELLEEVEMAYYVSEHHYIRHLAGTIMWMLGSPPRALTSDIQASKDSQEERIDV